MAASGGCRPRSSLVECAALLVRGGAVWQLVGLITRRSQVQILPPLPFATDCTIVQRIATSDGPLPTRRPDDRALPTVGALIVSGHGGGHPSSCTCAICRISL
jgi:hypothetical protein